MRLEDDTLIRPATPVCSGAAREWWRAEAVEGKTAETPVESGFWMCEAVLELLSLAC